MILVSTIIIFSLILTGCQSSDNQTLTTKKEIQTTKDVREIAWISLGDSERNEVVGDWKDAAVSKVTADKKRFALNDATFDGKEVTMVTFRSSNYSVLGDITKLVDEQSQKVVGGGLRE